MCKDLVSAFGKVSPKVGACGKLLRQGRTREGWGLHSTLWKPRSFLLYIYWTQGFQKSKAAAIYMNSQMDMGVRVYVKNGDQAEKSLEISRK